MPMHPGRHRLSVGNIHPIITEAPPQVGHLTHEIQPGAVIKDVAYGNVRPARCQFKRYCAPNIA